MMKNKKVTIIAGPCSVDEKNLAEIYQIAEMKVNGKKAVDGTRVVGLKSRSSLDPNGEGMGSDFKSLKKNHEILQKGGNVNDFETTESVKITKKLIEDTNMIIATEIIAPHLQMPLLEREIGVNGKIMPWNPSVNQLGWQLMEMADYVKRNKWNIGIKNGKWIGCDTHTAESESFKDQTSLEKTWSGLKGYIGDLEGDICFIQRGVDVPEKGLYRNLPVHNIARRVKLNNPGSKMYFDPSHSFGPKLRDEIVEGTIEAMKFLASEDEYLYDGVLIEVGTSQTDTEQHISIEELRGMIENINLFREL